MPKKPPPLPDADDLPEIETDDIFDDDTLALDASDRLSAELDVAQALEDISLQSFEDAPSGGPLDFDDGSDMGRHLH